MGNWTPGDQNAAWVTVFILVIFWALTLIPKFFTSTLYHREDDIVKISRAHNAYTNARDGVLLQLVATAIAFAGRSSTGATTALSYIFLADWILLLLTSYMTDSRKAHSALKLIGFILILANIIQALASANGRYI